MRVCVRESKKKRGSPGSMASPSCCILGRVCLPCFGVGTRGGRCRPWETGRGGKGGWGSGIAMFVSPPSPLLSPRRLGVLAEKFRPLRASWYGLLVLSRCRHVQGLRDGRRRDLLGTASFFFEGDSALPRCCRGRLSFGVWLCQGVQKCRCGDLWGGSKQSPLIAMFGGWRRLDV